MVHIKPNVSYRLLNLEAGTYLTISDDDNVSMVGQPYVDATPQEWIFEAAGGNVYFIKSANAEPQYLSLPNNEIVGGQKLMANTSPFIWIVSDVPNMCPVARITPARVPDLFVDLCAGDPEPGTKIQAWPESGNNQLWILEEVRK